MTDIEKLFESIKHSNAEGENFYNYHVNRKNFQELLEIQKGWIEQIASYLKEQTNNVNNFQLLHENILGTLEHVSFILMTTPAEGLNALIAHEYSKVLAELAKDLREKLEKAK